MLRFPSLALLLLLSTPPLYAQNLVSDIETAHGGRTSLDQRLEYEVRGTLQTGSERSVGFILKVSGENSRFELPDRVFVKRGATGQWWRTEGGISDARRVWEGLREVYLVPLFPVRELAARYNYDGARMERDDFSQHIRRRTHIGYRSKVPVVELAFHRQTHLLAEAVFSTASGNQTPVAITYANYQRLDGIPLPTLVTRQVGDGAIWTYTIETVDFNPVFSTGDFDFVARGGAR